jgi:RHS repeat-associated protein
MLLLSACLAGAITESANVSRGFQPERSFELGEIDHVNAFNGNLIVSIPIGPVYPVSPQLSYQFRLSWNSNVWDGDEGSVVGTTASYTNRASNAGLGWQFGLGRLAQPGQLGNRQDFPVYLSPDGGRTVFHETLIPGAADNDPGVLYSRDSKYLRVRNLGRCAGDPWTGRCDYEIDFPSGLVHKFQQEDGQLVSITDRFRNRVTLTYALDGSSWSINDGYRSHSVTLVPKSLDSGNTVRMVSSANLAAFGGTTASYAFEYSPTTDLPRASPFNDPAQSATAPTTLLLSVTGPHGWQISMPTYQLDAAGAPKFAGTLRKLVLPTGGALEWDYMMYNFASDSDAKPFLTGSAGVKRRRTLDSAGAVLGTWAYSATGNGLGARCSGGGSPLPNATLTRTVVSPPGDKTVRQFTAWPCGGAGPEGQDLGEYGLPYSRASVDAASGAFLSEELFDCNANASDPDSPTGCVSKRKIYVKYERDGSNPQEVGEAMNQRLAYQKLVYVDDGNKYKETTWSSFDGYGHYRTETLGGNFDAGNARTTTTNVTPLVSPWVLGVYDRIDRTEGGDTARQEFHFAQTTGFLDCVRTLRAGTGRGANDLLTRFTADAAGFVAQERFYGGDRQTIGTSGNCADGASAEYTLDHTHQSGARKSTKYAGVAWKALDLTIDANTGLPSASFDAAGMKTSYLYDALGRLVEERPEAKTGFAADAWTKIAYQFGSQRSGSSTSVSVYRCKSTSGSNCTSGNRLTHEYVDFDDLGRVWQEGRRLPGGAYNIRRTLYEAAGNRAQVSTFKDSASGSFQWTTFSGYDPFGRPASVSGPDGKTTSFTRAGDRTVETTQSIALSLTGAETNVKRRETYDRQGRLFRVEEYSNPSAPSTYVRTDYSYDEGGRLVRVCQNASGSSCGQERLWSYDNRGFLLSEKHPEKGTAGTGDDGFVFYSEYDSRGKAWRRRDGADDTAHELNFDFSDPAERLLSVTTSGGTELKSFTYDGAPGAGAGKLHTATRRNDLPSPTWGSNYQVTETYSYQGRMGWPSARTTSLAIGGVPQESWTLGARYHELGQVDALDYPECAGTGCTSHAAEPLAVGFTHEDGLLTSIPNWTSSQVTRPIGYHPNLQVASVAHGNGMTVTIANDPDRIPRPRSITVEALDDDFQPWAWSTGDYLYDGAGNVKSIGADLYKYDKVSRLVDSSLVASAGGRTQGYTFDLYGNLTSKTTDGVAITFPISQATNRLTTGSSYDAAGNQTAYNGSFYGFDLFNTMTTLDTGGELWGYVYTADDERVLALKSDGTKETWTLRDFGNRILRRDEWIAGNGEQTGTGTSSTCPPDPNPIYCQDFENGSYLDWDLIVSGAVGEVTDYVWRGEKLFASRSTQGGTRHFALDHLGTIRLVTDDFGQVAEQHAYFPFGEEATTNVSSEPMRFTGHERDLQSTPSNAADDLDQMHARFASPLMGRFLSVDPAGESAQPETPQSWNRYAEVIGNPLRYNDPTGRFAETPFDVGLAVVSIGQAIAAPTPANIVVALLDTGAVFTPGVPAVGGRLIDAAQAGSKAAIAAKAGSSAAKAFDASTFVYNSVDSSGKVVYVGITNDLARRGAEHAASKGIQIEKVFSGLTREDARAVEQVLIELHKLGKEGGTLLNKINSISKKNKKYGKQLQRGYELLQQSQMR